MGDIADLIGGNAWRSKDYSTDGKYLVVTIANVSGAPYINEMGNKINIVKKSPFILSKDDILVSLTGNVGRVSKMSDIPAVLNQRVGKIIPKARTTDRDFLFSLLHNSHFETAMIEAGQGAAQKNISNWDVLNYELCIPPESREQTQIGNFFSNLDSLIAAAERQEALLRQKKQAYLQLMFPREGETRPRLRFSGFTEEWQELQLGKLYMKNTERNGNQFDAEKTLSVSSMTFNPLGNGAAEESLATYKVLRIADAAFEGHTSNEFAFGRFVVNTVGAGIMSPRFASIRPTDFWWQSCDLDFWACYLHDEGVMKRILVRSTKRGTMMNELVFDDFFAEKMRVPSLPEQRLIGQFFNTLDSLIAAAEERTKHLRELKGSYLQRMFV